MTATAASTWACDTSVAIAVLDPSHPAHQRCRAVVLETRPALAGHAAFEAHSVLTRLPLALRLSPTQAADVLARAFPDPCWLDPDRSAELRRELGARGIVGGAVYDALVAWTASGVGRILLTRDKRARPTYAALAVEHRLIE